jgi:hypothetical protein
MGTVRGARKAAQFLLDSCVGSDHFFVVAFSRSFGLVGAGPVKPCGEWMLFIYSIASIILI